MTKRLGIVCLCVLLLAPSQMAWGVFGVADMTIVSDPSGLIQQTASALRQWVSNAHEVIMMENQTKGLINDATNLVKLPMDIIQDVQTSVGAYQQILAQAKGAYNSVTGTIDQFE